MKKWILLMLFVLVTVGILANKEFLIARQQPVIESIRVEKAQAKTQFKQVVNVPQISVNKLLAHVQKLNFQRYTNRERSLTRSYITTELQKLGWKPKLEKFSEGINIFAERQGTEKDAGAILVGAHYDTVAVSPGADDNATGVAVLLELARIFASHPTPRTLQLAFFDKEEAGLLGSKAFVSVPAHLKNLQGAIVMDMVGYACYTAGCQKYPAGLPVSPPSDRGDFLAVIGDTEHLPLLSAFTNTSDKKESLPPVLTLPIPMKGLFTPDTLRSDHAPFWYKGVGAVLVTDTANLRNSNYHKKSDTPSTIEGQFFTGSAQIVVNATNNLLQNTDILEINYQL